MDILQKVFKGRKCNHALNTVGEEIYRMYSYSTEKIPAFLPIKEGALLKPWFTTEMLDKGLELIRENRIQDFVFLRDSVGALVDQEAVVTQLFEASSKLHQGFTIREKYCSYCGHKAQDKGCEHLAALAILSLIKLGEKSKAVPVTSAFVESNWLNIGYFLQDWLKRDTISIQQSAGNGFTTWEIVATDGRIQVNLPNTWGNLTEHIGLSQAEHKGGKESTSGLAQLNDHLQASAIAPNERLLKEAGSSTSGWQRDTSFWLWLARMLFMLHKEKLPELCRNPSSSRFVLQIGDLEEPGALRVFLPKEKTWEAVQKITYTSEDLHVLPSAKECYRVYFNEEQILEIKPCLSLQDGRVLERKDLADCRFTGAYYLEGEGFLPAIRLPAEGTFNDPAQQGSSLPLLGFVQKEETRDMPFTVAPDKIQDFLSVNQKPLRFSDNIVDPELLQLQVHELPDHLVIESFEEHDGWCYLSCHYGVGNTSITLADILSAKEKEMNCLPGKQWLQLDGTPLSWLHELVQDRFDESGMGRIRLSYRELMALASVVPDVRMNIENQSLQQRLTELLDVDGWMENDSLTSIPDHLRNYQRNGLAWLHQLYAMGIGGLLADDMGLGKTHQGLALLQAAGVENPENPVLVICPASIVLSWVEKIDKFYQDLDYTIYYGQNRNLDKLQEKRTILTTYGVVRQDLELLRVPTFDVILIDEIQHLKNRATATHQAVAELNGRVKIGLTGTPVENSLQDLHSLFDICLPGLLGDPRQFQQQYVQRISEKEDDPVRERLKRLIRPFILRRSRSQVLTELPEVIEDDRMCVLSDDQIGLYREAIKENDMDIGALTGETSAVPYANILSTITRLKQICCHPCLVSDCEHSQEYSSGKWDLFVELSEELLAADMKFVVFSQYTKMLEIIEHHFETTGISMASLKGEMAIEKRQKMVDRFNSDPNCKVFCASLLAGGLGIDLTGAQAVIHYDRWWNPAREEQATARVHRMGQKSVVQVFRLITQGTLEEKIHHLIMQKRKLATSLIQEDDLGIIKQLDRRQLAELLKFSPAQF